MIILSVFESFAKIRNVFSEKHIGIKILFLHDHLTLKLIWLIATQCVPMLHLHVALFKPPPLPEKKKSPIYLACNHFTLQYNIFFE